MSQLILILFSIAALSHEALAGRYISSISMTVDSREGLYLEPPQTIASNSLLKLEVKAALKDLHTYNKRIVDYKEAIRTECYARNVRTGEFLRFSDLTDEEFIIWERMKDPKVDIKKYSAEYISQRKDQLAKIEKSHKEAVARIEADKLFEFGKGADTHAQALNIKAVQAEASREDGRLEKQTVEKISREFNEAEEKFLQGHHALSHTVKPKRAGKVPGAVGMAVVGASLVYDVANGEGAQASELKPSEFNSEGVENQNRSEVGIATLDDK